MAAYRVELGPAVQHDLRRIPQPELARVRAAVLALTDDPRPVGNQKLKGEANAYRVRVGNYRILYRVSDRDKLVQVVKVLRRSESTYRRL